MKNLITKSLMLTVFSLGIMSTAHAKKFTCTNGGGDFRVELLEGWDLARTATVTVFGNGHDITKVFEGPKVPKEADDVPTTVKYNLKLVSDLRGDVRGKDTGVSAVFIYDTEIKKAYYTYTDGNGSDDPVTLSCD